MPPIVLEGDFKVTQIDPHGRLYVRVSRAVCHSTSDASLSITTDYNREEYQISKDDLVHIAIATTLNREGRQEEAVYDHSLYHRDSLLSDYDYVTHGTIYECTTQSVGTDVSVEVFISFGGLLAKVAGTPSALRDLHRNSTVFMLIRKVK